MTTKEAKRALGEMTSKDIELEHRVEVVQLIKDNESAKEAPAHG